MLSSKMITTSIIIPSSRDQMLLETLESINKQTVRPIDVLVWKTDVSIHKWNTLVEICRGDAILILCDDDKLDPTFIEKVSKTMEETNADIVYTDIKYFGDSHAAVDTGRPKDLLKTNPIPITSLIRKSVWDELGGIDETTKYGDWDLWIRCYLAKKKFVHISEPLFNYRIHMGQDSHTVDSVEESKKILSRYV
jgi:GT2 family glycosyltransferase